MVRPFRLCVVLAATAAVTASAAAQARPSTPTMSCHAARDLVLQRGAVLLGTGGQTFDRYVADRSFCAPTETVRRALVPTRDTPACPVGYTCREPSRDDFFFAD